MTAAVKTLSVSGEEQARREMRKNNCAVRIICSFCESAYQSGRNNSFLAQLALDLGEVTVVN